MKLHARSLPLLMISATFAAAQPENDLKRYFEGKHVTVRMDMPGTHQGIDLHADRDPKIDMAKYSSRLKQYGVSIREGDRVMVTMIHVTKKNIEFQLAGGGFGTWGDTSGLPSVPSTYTSKSEREKRLERDLSRASDSEKQRIREALDRERRDRQRADRYARERSEVVKVERERMIQDRRRESGSRFNLWFPEGRLQESVPSPQEVMALLAGCVDFRETTARPGAAFTAPKRGGGGGGAGSAAQLQRGMARSHVHEMLGKPVSSRQSKQGELTVVVERFSTADAVADVTFAGDVVVKFSISSK